MPEYSHRHGREADQLSGYPEQAAHQPDAEAEEHSGDDADRERAG